MQFDQWLRAALISKAEEIKPTSDMWERVKVQVSIEKKKGRFMMLARNLMHYFFPWQPTWKKALAGALCGVLLVGGLTFGFSPQAQAWAKETFASIVFKVVRTADGYSVVKLGPGESMLETSGGFVFGAGKLDPAETPGKYQLKGEPGEIGVREGTSTPQYATAAEAEAKVGFPVHLPTYLPERYKLEFIAADKWETTGKGFVNVLYRVPEKASGLDLLDLMITDESGFLQGGDAVKEVKVGNKAAYWSEYPIASISAGNTEPTVKAGHMLKWIDKDIVYTLRDSSGELSMDEMLRIAASIK